MISSIPQEESGKTELTGFGTSHSTTCSKPKGPFRLSKSKILPHLVTNWCGVKVSSWGEGDGDNHNTVPDESITQLHLFTWSPLAFLN